MFSLPSPLLLPYIHSSILYPGEMFKLPNSALLTFKNFQVVLNHRMDSIEIGWKGMLGII